MFGWGPGLESGRYSMRQKEYSFRDPPFERKRKTWKHLGPSRPILGHVGTISAHLGGILVDFGAVLGHLGTTLGYFGAILGHIGAKSF